MNFIFASQKYENKFGFQDSTFPFQSFLKRAIKQPPKRPFQKRISTSIRAIQPFILQKKLRKKNNFFNRSFFV